MFEAKLSVRGLAGPELATPQHRPTTTRWLGLFLAVLVLLGCRTNPTVPEVAAITPSATSRVALPSATPTACAATLEVASDPLGVGLYVDGVLAGHTPLDVSVSPGQHTLRLEREGYAPATILTDVRCGQRLRIAETLRDRAAPSISLSPFPASVAPDQGLKIAARAEDNGTVAHMTLWVDDVQIYRVDEASLRHNLDTRALAPGSHRIVIEARDAAGNAAQATGSFELATPGAAAPFTPTPEPTASLAATAIPQAVVTIPAPTPTHSPVQISQDTVSIATYAYQQALYTAQEQTGHPYPLLHRDQVGAPVARDYGVIRLRNNYLELTILPEMGGRIYQVRYLPTGQDLLYNNKVIKPTHWGPEDQGWWLAIGGIEFCLPVSEHGYVTAQPWSAETHQGPDGSASVVLEILEASRDILARIEVTLQPEQAAFTIDSTLRNTATAPQELQYWLNAMLSPGRHGVGPGLRFYYPATDVVVHSRSDGSLPAGGQTMAWPLYQGRDHSRYENWPDYLGVFAPTLTMSYSAVYDEATQIGMLRVVPPDLAQGVKLFAWGPGFGDTAAYTDDGSRYVEMWGGLTPTFDDDATLAPQEALHWRETWYPIAKCGGVTAANDRAALYAVKTDDRLELSITSPQKGRRRLEVSQSGAELLVEPFQADPAEAYRLIVPLSGNLNAPITVRIVDHLQEILLEHTL